MSLNNVPFAYAGSITSGGTPQRLIPLNTEVGPYGAATIKARDGNTGSLYLGSATTGGGSSGSGISATTGFELKAGEAVSINTNSLGNFYVDGTVTGDKYDILEV